MKHPPRQFTRHDMSQFLHLYKSFPICKVCGSRIRLGEWVTHSRHSNYRHLHHYGESRLREDVAESFWTSPVLAGYVQISDRRQAHRNGNRKSTPPREWLHSLR